MREWLKELRHEKKLPQKEAARILGIGASTYSMIENGQRQENLRMDTARKIADVFCIPISYVFEHELKSDCVKK